MSPAIAKMIKDDSGSHNPVLVTSASIRPFVRGIVERFRAQTPVMSQAEIHPRARLKTVGTV